MHIAKPHAGWSSVLHRKLPNHPTLATRKMGAEIETDAGNVIDMSSGAGVCSLGHMNVSGDGFYVHSQNWTSNSVERFADYLLYHAERYAVRQNQWGHGGVMFLTGGTEAVEAACKIAYQSQVERGRRGTPRFFARRHSYHGNSMFALALGDHPRRIALDPVIKTLPTERFDAFKPSWVGESPGSPEYITACLAKLDIELSRARSEGVPAIVIVEPVGGLAIGIEPASFGYLAKLRAITRDHGATLIYDEVLCGNWRLDHMYAWQHFQQNQVEQDVAPDIVVMGKGLANGAVPISAVVLSTITRNTLKSGKAWHTATFQNHPTSCALAMSMQMKIESLGEQRHKLLAVMAEETEMLRASPGIEAVVGLGLLYGVRFNRHAMGLHDRIRAELLKWGVNVYTDGGTVEASGNWILLAPPYVIKHDAFRKGCEAIKVAAKNVT